MSHKKKVLIVDDDKLIGEQLDQALKRNFFDTFLAENGKDALEIIGQNQIDVALLDVNLPDINGLEVLKQCKEKSFKTEVIVITGFGSQDVAINALRAGAIDYIEKPINMDELNAAMGRALEKQETQENLPSKHTILVIDDEPVPAKTIRRIVEREGFTAFEAHNGKEGLDIIKENKIDLVITDIKMPEMDGLTVLKEARKLYSDIEIIMVTGHGDQEVAVEALRLGAIDYLRKPINLDELLVSIDKAIDKIGLNRTRLYRNRELKLSAEIFSKMNEELEKRITSRTKKLAETQSALFQTSKLATLGEMSAGLAHEMNQPMTGISLTTENMKQLMKRGALTDEAMKEAIEDIDHSVIRMSKIITHIRTFARQESLKFIAVKVNDPIENALNLLGEQLRLHEISVIRKYADDLPTITGEPYQLEQVITNIVTNARDAMDERGEKEKEGYSKELIFKTAQINDEIRISISDNGYGMSEHQRKKVFEPFFTTKEVGKSTGLGMSISFGIIESHKGRIEIESTEGEGTTVNVVLPLNFIPED